MTPEHCLSMLSSLRQADRFHPAQDPHELIRALHPPSLDALVLGLSYVTSAFYGLMLQTVATSLEPRFVDQMSRRFFHKLGALKARALRLDDAASATLHGDSRDVINVLIAAIYGASPEYHFEVLRYDGQCSEVVLFGVDRYHRIATELGFVEQLFWPALHPFFEGVIEELELDCRVESQVLQVAAGSQLRCRYVVHGEVSSA